MTTEQKKIWTSLRQANSRKNKQRKRQDGEANNIPSQYSNFRNNNSTTETYEFENEESSQKNHLEDLPINTNEINDTGKKWLNYTLANAHAFVR